MKKTTPKLEFEILIDESLSTLNPKSALKPIRIKIELSPVIRGSVFPEKNMEVSNAVQENFGYAEIAVASFPDLYAGKICAALDRQHPRDLFDIKFLYDNEGLTPELRKTFLVYLISHHRPIAEVLDPPRKDIKGIYENEFVRMAQVDVPVQELEAVRERLIADIHAGITEEEKQFLLSFKNRSPQWDLFGMDKVQNLPSVRWKMLNLEKMPGEKHREAFKKLEQVLLKDKNKP